MNEMENKKENTGYKNYVLTDFSTERWKGINLQSVEDALYETNERINKQGCIFGELWHKSNFANTDLENVSHSIKNLQLQNDKITGDIKFLDNVKGNCAKKMYRK